MDAKAEAIATADAELSNVGLPTYSEVVQLLLAAEKLGLTFDIGSAYISRAYIDKQTALRKEIKRVKEN